MYSIAESDDYSYTVLCEKAFQNGDTAMEGFLRMSEQTVHGTL
jgi:hypothetical protein